ADSWQQNQLHPEIVPLTAAYMHASPGDGVTYTIQHSDNTTVQTTLQAVSFTWDMWFENYGLTMLAGISWLLVGTLLLVTARDWTGAVEGITLLPPAMLFLLYSHWGNVQQAYPADIVFQLLWVPSFALLGAAFIHLSLTYRPEALSAPRRPRLMVDGLPYLPLIALVAFEWSSFLIFGKVAGRPHFIVALSYGVFGGVLSFVIGVISLLRVSRIIPGARIPDNVRRRLRDLLTLWIGGVGLGFCFGILPILLTGHPFLSIQIFTVLAIVYPLLLLYAIRSLRLIDQLQLTLEQREGALRELQQTAAALQQSNSELQQATSLLLHADAHLRSVLSPRKVQPDLWALDALSQDLEQTEEGTKIAEAISYTVTQALLNVYNHAGASFATVQTVRRNGYIDVYITDDGRGFDTSSISLEK